MSPVRSEQCERARRWLSLKLDGELSELGRVRLQSHLEACPECAAYARNVTVVTSRLRTEPLALPTHDFELPRRRRPFPRALQVAAAAIAVGAAIGLGSLAGSLSAGHPGAPSAAEVAATQQPYLERQLLALDTSLHKRLPHGRMVPV